MPPTVQHVVKLVIVYGINTRYDVCNGWECEFFHIWKAYTVIYKSLNKNGQTFYYKTIASVVIIKSRCQAGKTMQVSVVVVL